MSKRIVQVFAFLFLTGTSIASYSQIPGQINPNQVPPPGATNAVNTGTVVGGGPYAPGTAVMVKWKGSWWPAHVMQVGPQGNRWFIHYDGYSSSWDEWVGPGRIRPR